MPDSVRPQGAHLRGQIFLARFDYVRRLHGIETFDQVMAALPDEERELLSMVDRAGWYPYRVLVHLDHAIRDVLDPDDPGIYDRLGAASAEMRNEWVGEHASLLNVHAFLSRVADEHGDFHTFGRGVYGKLGFAEGEIAFSDYPECDESYCEGARGYLRRTVEMITNAPVRIEERECQRRGQPTCTFRLRWVARP